MKETTELIQRKQPLRDSPIWEAQAKLTARVIQEAAEALSFLGDPDDPYDVPLARATDGSIAPYQWNLIGPALFEEYEYQLLIQVLYACGWACQDFPLDDFLPQVNRDVAGTVGVWDLPQLRLYLHTLVRGEKWCDGDSSVVLEAFASGALQTIAKRLQEDESLFVPL